MTGKVQSQLAKTVSLKKAKAVSKKMGVTFNDLITGVISVVFQKLFNKHGDK